MLSRRSSAGVAVLDGMLYVAGGNDGTSCLNSVERFNPKTNTWEGVAPMNIRRLVSPEQGFVLDQTGQESPGPVEKLGYILKQLKV